MRIIAGAFKGRQFKSPSGNKTHPMSDKVRGAIFNTLGDVEGLSLLDAFSGSGALSFEAVSRGASNAIAIDNDINAHKTIQTNIDLLGLKYRIKAIRANVSGWSEQNPDTEFDLVICDPPYDQFKPSIIQKLVGHLKADGVFILSLPGRSETPEFQGLSLLDQKNYGDAQLVYYKKVL